ncbi:MAG TPA: hypothetical protein RMH99_08920 [Sandaracinaceae bacterium LLY-WYZ-13_1]|nr:hypothetical protein [Sandaracinaceae bacterium LLY-WYZ-13_1]
MLRTLSVLLAAALLVALTADVADAQRRRRRRRQRPPAAEQTPPDAGAEGEGAEGDAAAPPASPFEDEPTEGGDVEGGEGEGEGAEGEAPPEEPTTEPTETFDPGPAPPDVSPIRADYVTLMDDLVQARMRVSALGSELFQTRIEVDLQDRTGDETTLARLVVHLDGAPIHQSEGALSGGDDGAQVFAGSLAPGPHVLTLEVEQRAREDDDYRYTLRESFRFQVARERLSEVTLILEDDSDMARSFPSGGEGRYEVRTRMRVATRALPDGD